MKKITRSTVVVLLLDLVTVNAAVLLAILVSCNFSMSEAASVLLSDWIRLAPWYSLITVAVFVFFRLYHMIWTLVSLREILRVIPAVIVSFSVGMLVGLAKDITFSLGIYFLIFVFTLAAAVLLRCSYRVYRSFFFRNTDRADEDGRINVMIIGAGKAGQSITRELLSMEMLNRKVCCIIDDNPAKHGRYLEGVPIVGDSSTILSNAKKYQIGEIIFAIPSALPKQRHEILKICNQSGCVLKALPGIYQIIDGEVSVKALRDVRVEDLLAREPVEVNNVEILEQLRGKTVLVTGGGGSIGSELCRQIADHQPGALIILDVYENNAYDIQQELKRRYPGINLCVEIGSVRDAERINVIFSKYRPQIVFHAAAHKHVPLMEDAPCEAIKNNVFGTFNVAGMAAKYGCDRFLLISTDKAVNPTNIMGASKRLCEMVVQYMASCSETKFVAVRFGNVLGSNGSVVPLFYRQIAEGGPVTVTHKDVIRYFMTIPEAVSLILQASAFAENGETYVLDMGDPVRIDDMARNMIRLCGMEPDVDIPIVYTGLRPGEKLYEELLMDEEGLRKTENKMIFIGRPTAMDNRDFLEKLKQLQDAAERNDPQIRSIVAQLVPTYQCEQEPVSI